jgi:hypothetical protein
MQRNLYPEVSDRIIGEQRGAGGSRRTDCSPEARASLAPGCAPHRASGLIYLVGRKTKQKLEEMTAVP